jgi:uncharacterized phage-associated protein
MNVCWNRKIGGFQKNRGFATLKCLFSRTIQVDECTYSGSRMPYDAKAVANFFLDLAKKEGKILGPMKLQKLVYFAHGWTLAITGEPLIDEPVQAWRWGPVIPSLYHAFKAYGSSHIDEPATSVELSEDDMSVQTVTPKIPASDGATRAILERVWRIYSPFSPVQLSNLTHEPGTPWDQTVKVYGGSLPKRLPISNEVIGEYFRKMAFRKT